MPDIDLQRLSLVPEHRLKPVPSRRPPRPRSGERFLKGPIPWDWLCRALALPGKAGAVGVALWYWAGLTRQRHVKVSYTELERMGVNRFAARRGILALEAAGLVETERKPGRAPVATILEIPCEPTCSP